MATRKIQSRRPRTKSGAKPSPKVAERRLVETRGIKALSLADQLAIRQTVERFTGSRLANGEHGFGVFTHDGMKIFWAIDDYPDSSEDPKRPLKIVCIMLADEC